MRFISRFYLLAFFFGCAQENKTGTPQIGSNYLTVKPAIEAFASDPIAIIPGETKSLRIMWKIVGINPSKNSSDEIYVSGIGKIEQNAGFYDFEDVPTEETVFTITATNGKENLEQQLTVSIDTASNAAIKNFKIVFTSSKEIDSDFVALHNATKSMHLYKIAPDGTEIKKLTKDDKLLLASDPTWSLARKRIIFSGNLTHSDPSQDVQSIYEMDVNGDNVKALTAATPGSNMQDRLPDVSPDGTNIIYTSTSLERAADGNFTHGIKSLNIADGKKEIKNLLWAPGFIYAYSSYHPSGEKIILNSSKDTPSGSYAAEDRDIYIYNLTNQEFVRITNDQKSDLAPVFSPDGQKILWCSNAQGNDDIYILDLSEENPQAINLTTDNLGADNHPAWSPDGKSIAFESVRPVTTSVSEIWIMDFEGKNLRQVTKDLNAKNPVWIEP